MRTLAIVPICLVLFTTAALAQIDPDPDGIGIYADLTATEVSISATPGQLVPVYLLVTRPSTPVGIVTWACTIVVPPNAQIVAWYIPGEFLNFATPPDFVVCSPATPHPTAPIIHVMTFYIQMSDAAPAFFYVTGSENAGPGYDAHPVYLETGDDDYIAHYMHCYPNGQEQPVFAVNAPMTPVESATWGGVKALFR
jgi:hypothetical protein